MTMSPPDRVTSSTGDELMVAFEALSTYLKAHEAAEQTVVRPVTEETAAPGAAEDRITEERTAEKSLAALADMGVQPGTLRPGLVAAAASTDATAPTSVVTSPAAGATIPSGQSTTISGPFTRAGGADCASAAFPAITAAPASRVRRVRCHIVFFSRESNDQRRSMKVRCPPTA
mgnify:CR=1 FL=1